MPFRRSLRYRVGFALALFGGLASLLLSAALFLFFHQIEGRFIDDALDSEIEEFLAARVLNPDSPLPRTSLFRAYSHAASSDPAFPHELDGLAPGRHQMMLNGRLYRAAVIDTAGERLYLLYDESGLLRRERRLKLALALGIAVMMLLSATAGTWMAGRVIAPVRQLGRRVRGLDPAGDTPLFAGDFADDEVGELAQTMEGYIARLHAFIERERNFTADASHELRTPVSIIAGAVEVMLADPAVPEEQRRRLERIERAAHDMRIVMDALLALAREAGDGAGAQGDCDVEEVVREVIEQHRPLAKGRPIELQVEIRGCARIRAQRSLLAVAIGNLVRNAITHTVEGRITVTLMADRVIVEDRGPGFGGREAQGVAGVNRKGIGLSLVRRVCARYGWDLSITDGDKGGARVELRFIQHGGTASVSP